jgi:hypothetical protein
MSVKCIRSLAGLAVGALALSSCGTPTSPATTTARPTATPLARPSAATGPCASVRTTTAIDQVPAACAALWAPYGVTKVPPANLTDSTPAPRDVVNATNGAVSDADAHAWALAANRAGTWLQWSEANDQFGLTTRIEGAQVVNAQIDKFMRQGIAVMDPSCDLFAQDYRVFPMTNAGTTFFSSFGESTRDGFVLVERYPGPCAITGKDAQGNIRTLLSTATPTVSISAGEIRTDPLLGRIWFGDGAAFCTDRGAPLNWCAQ